MLTVYDDNGVYGHPDHIQVHRVGVRAAELAGTPTVYESTFNRDHLVALLKANADRKLPEGVDPSDIPDADTIAVGVSASEITTTVDVREYVDRKRAAMAAHASQIGENSWFLQMPLDVFTEAFGYEWFIRRGAPAGARERASSTTDRSSIAVARRAPLADARSAACLLVGGRLQQLGQCIGDVGRDALDVGYELPAADQPEADGVEVAEHRDVQARPGHHRSEREQAREPGAREVERERRARHVRDDEVDDRRVPALQQPLVDRGCRG